MKTCPACLKEFEPNVPSRKYCCKKCAHKQCRQYYNEYYRKYRMTHKIQFKAINRKKYVKRKDKVKEYSRLYYLKHEGRIREHQKLYVVLNKQTNIERVREWRRNNFAKYMAYKKQYATTYYQRKKLEEAI